MIPFNKALAMFLRAAAFLSAAAAFVLTTVNAEKFSQAVQTIHALLWIYASIAVSIKLAAKVTPPAASKTTPVHSSRGVILLSIAVWIALLAAGYSLFSLLPFKSYSLLVAAVAFLGVLEIFFINTWCPFARLITHARCCYSCRLKNWGETMVLSPLIAMPNWWNMALLALAFLLLIKYEVLYKLYSGMNPANKSCSACSQQCALKNKEASRTETITP